MNTDAGFEDVVVPATLGGERVDRAVALLTGWTRSDVEELIRGGAVLIDGATVKKSRTLTAGEILTVSAEPPSPGLPQPEAIPLEVRYDDPDLFVIAKPAGMVVHPAPGHPSGTLVNALLALDPGLAAVGDPERPGIVHRLDRDTSGLLIVARRATAYEALVGALAARRVTRGYRALVWGELSSRRGLIDAPIGRSVRTPTRMAVREGGKDARTAYEVVETFPESEISLLDVQLETGRTHQIRVHLAAIDHPVVGDRAYGGARSTFALDRPFLHAAHLEFEHPSSGARLTFDEPLPDELELALAALRA